MGNRGVFFSDAKEERLKLVDGLRQRRSSKSRNEPVRVKSLIDSLTSRQRDLSDQPPMLLCLLTHIWILLSRKGSIFFYS